MDWNMVAACANVVIATTAVIASWYALRQYRHAIRASEMNQVLSMHSTFRELSRRGPADGTEPDDDLFEEAIELLALHERLVATKLLSKNAVAFYRDVFIISNVFSSVKDPALSKLRKLFKDDPIAYRHLITTLSRDPKTRYIVES